MDRLEALSYGVGDIWAWRRGDLGDRSTQFAPAEVSGFESFVSYGRKPFADEGELILWYVIEFNG